MKHNSAIFSKLTGSSEEQAALRLERYRQTFESMKPWFPKQNVENFLDIGCGLGGVAAYVADYFPSSSVHLLDGDGVHERSVYRDKTDPWADVALAVRVVQDARPNQSVQGWQPHEIDKIPPCELVYSNCSWGHHYSIETYIGLVSRCLAKGGVLIVDLRKGDVGSYGDHLLSQYFSKVIDLDTGKKYVRTVWGATS